ncbi:MAG: cold-shock protein [Candidatus Gracilibacteria bacterium]
MTGVIKTLKAGFGFITPDEKGPDIFFHAKQLRGVMFDDLRTGDRLSYDEQESDRGINAVNVELVRENNSQSSHDEDMNA